MPCARPGGETPVRDAGNARGVEIRPRTCDSGKESACASRHPGGIAAPAPTQGNPMERNDSPDNLDIAKLFENQTFFEPDWARTPPSNPYVDREDAPREPFRPGRDERPGRDRRGPRRDGERRPGGFRRDGDRPPRRDGDRPQRRDGERPFRRDGDRPPRREGDRPFRHDGEKRGFRRDGERRPPAEPLFLKFSFFPDRATLTTIADNIRATGRVFSLVALAKLFLSHENSYSVKIERLAKAEPRPDRRGAEKPAAAEAPAEEAAPAGEAEEKKPAEAPTLCQCLVCKRVFRSLPKAETHVFSAHLEEFFDVERVENPQPASPVSCVARCGLTGELLGPPNSHHYTTRLHEIWKSRFSSMLWTDYLSRVQLLRDEESLEKWKEQAKFKTVYRLKAEAPKKAEDKPAEKPADGAAEAEGAPEEAPAEAAAESEAAAPAADAREEMTRAQAEEWTKAHRRSQLLRISPRCILSGAQTGEIDDPAIRNAYARERAREDRFPLTLLLALRTALKRMRLHIFKLGGRETFVSAVEPKYFSLDTLPEDERRVVGVILASGEEKATRRAVLAALAPDKAEDSQEALELLGTIRKLTQAGHVLLFEDGSLKALVRAEPPKPAEIPAEEAGKAPETAEKPAGEAEKAEIPSENGEKEAEKPTETAENAPETPARPEIPDGLPAPAELCGENAALQTEIDGIVARNDELLAKIAEKPSKKPAEGAGKAPEAPARPEIPADLPAPAALCGENAALQTEIDGIVARNDALLAKIAEKPVENAGNPAETAEKPAEPAEKPAEGPAEPPQAEENA
jgi:hypothetical protein